MNIEWHDNLNLKFKVKKAKKKKIRLVNETIQTNNQTKELREHTLTSPE